MAPPRLSAAAFRMVVSRLLPLVNLLLVLLLEKAEGRRLLRRNIRLFASRCDCECCEVSRRPPSLVLGGDELLCAPPSPEDNKCGEQCYTDSSDVVVRTAVGNTMDYQRFCFFECKPPKDAVVGLECAALEPEDIQKVKTAGGNGLDQAAVSQGVPVAAAAPPAPEAEAAPEEEEKAEAPKKDKGGQSAAAGTAADAAKEAIAAATEARASSAETAAQKANAAATTALTEAMGAASANQNQVTQLLSMETQASLHTRAAAEARKIAEAALAQIESAAKNAAVAAGAAAAAQLQADADAATAKANALRAANNPPPAVLALAGQKAAAPYGAALGKAMGIQALYGDTAQNMMATAAQLQQNARELSSNANAYQSVGNTAGATEMLGRAQAMLGQASALSSEAASYQAVAQKINKELPAYMISANIAAARAQFLANPAGQPPPPLPI